MGGRAENGRRFFAVPTTARGNQRDQPIGLSSLSRLGQPCTRQIQPSFPPVYHYVLFLRSDVPGILAMHLRSRKDNVKSEGVDDVVDDSNDDDDDDDPPS